MSRQKTLAEQVPDYAERRRRIEAEALPRNIHALIAEAAREAGDTIAWDFFESAERATYREMYAKVIRLAAGLQSIGVDRGSHVAVMLPNIEAFPVTWLAIGVIGAVMVPVNVGYRPRELVHVLDDSEARFLIVDAARLDIVVPGLDSGEIKLARDRIVVARGQPPAGMLAWSDLAASQAQPTIPDVLPEELLNIQYTSGTTGFPKGCMLAQAYWLVSGKVNAFRDGRRYRRILASTPFYYMDPQWLLLMAFYQRGTLYVASRQSTSRFIGWLRSYRIEFCLFPYVVYKQPASADDRVESVIRGNVYGVPKGIHAALEARFDFCAREAYGMTEVGSAMFMPIECSDMVGSGSCGKPSPFRECRIVDEQGAEVPVGDVGELLVRGQGILAGYYNKPDATARALREGWFHTGDLFRRDAQGFFHIVGRAKDMIRRSSENIAANEVEAVLNSVPGVLESAVIGVPSELRGEEVKAFIVLQDAAAVSQRMLAELIATCTAQLAGFKVPRYFSFPPALPKTPSLKIAKQVLKAHALEAREPTFDRVAQRWLDTASAQEPA